MRLHAGPHNLSGLGKYLRGPPRPASVPSNIVLQSAAGGVVVFWLLMLLVGLALVVWTYRDAQERSTHPPFLWAIVVFLAPLLGIVLYLLLGRDAV